MSFIFTPSQASQKTKKIGLEFHNNKNKTNIF